MKSFCSKSSGFFVLVILLLNLSAYAQRVTVLHHLDIGLGSLRSSIQAANPNDTIDFSLITDNNPIVLESELLITKPLVFVGNGSNLTSISGNNATRIFNINHAGKVSFVNLTLTNGNTGGAGAGIKTLNTDVILNGVVIDSCTAVGSGPQIGGGAIWNDGGKIEILNNTVISNNTASHGGAIYNMENGIVVIDNAQLQGNLSQSKGGAVYAENNSQVLLANSILNFNSAGLSGGAGYFVSGAFVIENCIFASNFAGGTTENEGGGALYNEGGSIQVRNFTQFNNNSTTGSEASGGAIFNGGIAIIEKSFFNDNSSLKKGGAIFEIGVNPILNETKESSFNNNTAQFGGAIYIKSPGEYSLNKNQINGNMADNGGGLYLEDGTLRLKESNLSGNTATPAVSNQGGGGVFVEKGDLIASQLCQFTDNRAEGMEAEGGAIYISPLGTSLIEESTFAGNFAENKGGAIANHSVESNGLNISLSTLENNSVNSNGAGGALYLASLTSFQSIGNSFNNNSASWGGGLYAEGGAITLDATSFDGNAAIGPKGGGGMYLVNTTASLLAQTIFENNTANHPDAMGGGIFFDQKCGAQLSQVTFRGNSSSLGGGGFTTAGEQTNVVVSNSTFTTNNVSGSLGKGGGMYLQSPSQVFIENSTIQDHYAPLQGGAIWSDIESLSISNCNLLDNTIDGQSLEDGGGAIFLKNTQCTLENSTLVSGNRVNTLGNGGAISMTDGASLTLDLTLFSNNSSPVHGGAVFVPSQSKADVLNSYFQFNSAPNGNGGAIYMESGLTSTFFNSQFSNNSGLDFGGAIWTDSAQVEIQKCLFDNNQITSLELDRGGAAVYMNTGRLLIGGASEFYNNNNLGEYSSGGAVWNNNGTLLVDSTTFSNNSTGRDGGAIVSYSPADTSAVINNSTFTNNTSNGPEGNGGAITLVNNIRHAEVNNSYFAKNSSIVRGGALFVEAESFYLTETRLDSNKVLGGMQAANGGGGLFFAGGLAQIQRCGFHFNETIGTSGDGGAFHNFKGDVFISHSTFSFNESQNTGGAIYNWGETWISFATIVENSAQLGGGISQSTVNDRSYFSNSILAMNSSADGNSNDIYLEVGNVESFGYNLFGSSNGQDILPTTGDLYGTIPTPLNPELNAMNADGLYIPICGSPVVNSADPANADLDQLGNAVYNGAKDRGAIELQDSCNAVGIDVLARATQMDLFPNPAVSGTPVQLQFEKLTSGVLTIRNLQGQVFRVQAFDTQSFEVSTVGLRAGIYLFHIQGADFQETKRLTVQ